jgi:hypothetical protein
MGRRQKGYRLATALRREREMRHLIPASATITYLPDGVLEVHDYRMPTKDARIVRVPEAEFDADHREYFRRARRLAVVGAEQERLFANRVVQGLNKMLGHSRRSMIGQGTKRSRRLARAARFAVVDQNIRRIVREEEDRIRAAMDRAEHVAVHGDGLTHKIQPVDWSNADHFSLPVVRIEDIPPKLIGFQK